MSYATDHLAWQQRVAQEDRAVNRLSSYSSGGGYRNPTDVFYKQWTKKHFVSSSKQQYLPIHHKNDSVSNISHDGVHPSIKNELKRNFFRQRNNKKSSSKLNQTAKGLDSALFANLHQPRRSKPPPFFEQAYCGRSQVQSMRSDRASSVGSYRPYSNVPQDDAISYFEYKDRQQKQWTKSKGNRGHNISQGIADNVKETLKKSKFNSTFYNEDDKKGLITNPKYRMTHK